MKFLDKIPSLPNEVADFWNHKIKNAMKKRDHHNGLGVNTMFPSFLELNNIKDIFSVLDRAMMPDNNASIVEFLSILKDNGIDISSILEVENKGSYVEIHLDYLLATYQKISPELAHHYLSESIPNTPISNDKISLFVKLVAVMENVSYDFFVDNIEKLEVDPSLFNYENQKLIKHYLSQNFSQTSQEKYYPAHD